MGGEAYEEDDCREGVAQNPFTYRPKVQEHHREEEVSPGPGVGNALIKASAVPAHEHDRRRRVSEQEPR